MTADADMVEDAELLYRSVPKGCFSIIDGHLKLSSTAFNDSTQKPSVDRAKLCGFNPAYTKKKPTDGVVSLTARSVRQIAGVVQNNKDGKPILIHIVDVIPDQIKDHPSLPDNFAHALVAARPDFANDKVFNRLKESLARIASQAGWLIEPS